MPFQPRDQEEIYTSLRDRLTGKIRGLSNFVQSSFNYVWTHDAFAEFFRRYEVALLAAQLSTMPDYAGGPITQADLEELGIADVDPEEVNKYMDDSDLDQLATLMGLTRSEGTKAMGTVTFACSDDTVEVPEGAEVGTEPDADGNYYSYFTTESGSPASGETTVDLTVEAEEVGSEYNIGSGRITFQPSPTSGVQGVVNHTAIGGGEDRESNNELRERVKGAVITESGGGTVGGIEGYIESELDDVRDTNIIEYPNADPPHAEVYFHGGEVADVASALDASRPSGVRHDPIKATNREISVAVAVDGNGIDSRYVEKVITTYVSELLIGEDVIRERIIQKAMNADNSIYDINELFLVVEDEPHTFENGKIEYQMDRGLRVNGVTEIVDESGNTYTEGIDFDEVQIEDEGLEYVVRWLTGADTPDDGETFYVSYATFDDADMSEIEVGVPGTVSVQETETADIGL